MRWPIVLVVAAAVAAAAGGTGVAATKGPSSAGRGSPQQARTAQGVSRVPALEDEVLAAINAYRTQHGLVALRFNTQLAATAREHSLSMATNGYFEHSSVHTGAPVLEACPGEVLGARSHDAWIIGRESRLGLARSERPGRRSSMWLQSPEHRKNLLRPAWREIGLGRRPLRFPRDPASMAVSPRRS